MPGQHRKITAAAHPISASAPTSLSLRAEPAKEASPAPAPPPAPRLSAARAAVDDDDGDDMFLLDEEIAAQKNVRHRPLPPFPLPFQKSRHHHSYRTRLSTFAQLTDSSRLVGGARQGQR